MSRRIARLVDLEPHWVIFHGKEGDSPDAIYFNCPEGHDDCRHVIPFTTALDGSPRSPEPGRVQWRRTGDTFETLTLEPSIRRIQRYADKAAAIAAGCLEQYITETLFCALHIFIRDGQIEFCGDSK